MKRALPTLIAGFIAILLLDIVGSFTSQKMGFSYYYLMPLSLAVYIIVPFLIAKQTDKKTAIISAGLVGFFDATIGWKLSSLIKTMPYPGDDQFSQVVLISTIISVTVLALLMGVLGSWLATRTLTVNKV